MCLLVRDKEHMCECWSSGAVPLSSSPLFKTNLSFPLCYVFSSHKRKEVQTPVFVAFHRPHEPSFTFLPLAWCQIWLWGSSFGLIVGLNWWTRFRVLSRVAQTFSPPPASPLLHFAISLTKCPGPAKSSSSSPPPPISSIISSPRPHTHLFL